MKGQELKLIREFKQQQTEIENYVMTDSSRIIAEYADKKGQEKYKLIKELIDDLDVTLSEMNDLESFESNMTEYYRKQNSLCDAITEINKYFETSSTFSQEVLRLERDAIRSKLDKLYEIIIIAEYFNYHKTTNNLKFQRKKLFDVITWSMNESVQDTVKIYKQAINKILLPIQIKTEQNIELYTSFVNELKEEHKEQHNKLKKILSCREMNRLMKELGYNPTRQKGSHKIYTDGVYCVPVPQHSKKLNKNLSYTIQKQVRVN